MTKRLDKENPKRVQIAFIVTKSMLDDIESVATDLNAGAELRPWHLPSSNKRAAAIRLLVKLGYEEYQKRSKARKNPGALTREEVIAAYDRDPSGAELAYLLTERGVGVPTEKNSPPRKIPFRPLPKV